MSSSSHIIAIARVIEHAKAVFEDEAKVKAWLDKPNGALNQAKPIELIFLPDGLNKIDNILTRIEEGIYS